MFISKGKGEIGKTIVEKIIREHCGKNVKAGDFTVTKIDMGMLHDLSGPLSVWT
jgi:homoaconitase/3-isopropylmalate dehydratase large subunit